MIVDKNGPVAIDSNIPIRVHIATEILAARIGRCIPIQEMTKQQRRELIVELLEVADALVDIHNKQQG